MFSHQFQFRKYVQYLSLQQKDDSTLTNNLVLDILHDYSDSELEVNDNFDFDEEIENVEDKVYCFYLLVFYFYKKTKYFWKMKIK